VPIIAGRDFRLTDNRMVKRASATDDFDTVPTAVVINEKFAQKFFAGRNPVGMHLGFGTDPGTHTEMEIIGVVKDIKYTNLRDEIPIQAYIPYMNSPYLGGMTIYVRTAGDPSQLITSIRAKVREMNANLADLCDAYDGGADQQFAFDGANDRELVYRVWICGHRAGDYRVVRRDVVQRGAAHSGDWYPDGAGRGAAEGYWDGDARSAHTDRDWHGVGVPAALVLTRVVKSQLYGLEAHDPWTLGLATGLLAIVACAAGYIPALRASRVDPMKALRYE